MADELASRRKLREAIMGVWRAGLASSQAAQNALEEAKAVSHSFAFGIIKGELRHHLQNPNRPIPPKNFASQSSRRALTT